MKFFGYAIAGLAIASVGVPAMAATMVGGVPVAEGGLGSRIIADGGNVTAYFEGNNASYTDLLFRVRGEEEDQFVFNNQEASVGDSANLGFFESGTEIIFRLQVQNTDEEWFTGPAGRNDDGVAHARVEDGYGEFGRTLVSFEDLSASVSDSDYNDLSFSFSNTSMAPVPLPASMPLLAFGLLGFGFVARRRRSAA